MTCLSILHVSDVHFGCDNELGEQGTITKALIRDAHNHAGLEEIRKPDICIFSGDLSQNGTLEQLAAGEQWLEKLVKPWGCPLFVVPGNHEVNRPEKDSELMRQMKARLVAASTKESNYNEQRSSIDKAECLTQFFSWHKAARSRSSKVASNWHKSNFATYHKLPIDDLIVHFIGLNTAIASCSDEDKGKLVADIRELNTLLEPTNSENELIIVVGHHPIQFKESSHRSNEIWLAKWNNELLAKRLLQAHGPHIYLHGHVHQLAGSALANNMGQQLVIFGAGASYQGSKYKQKFAFYEIDLKKREIRPSTLSYSTEGGDWVQSPAESRAMGLPLSFPNIVAKSKNIGPTIPRSKRPSVSGVDANPQLLAKAYDHTLRSINRLVNNLYPRNPGKDRLRHYFLDIKNATVIDKNGDGVVTSTFIIVAGPQPVHFWKTWIRVEEDSPSISNFMGMNLEILDITKDSKYEIVYLPARDDGHYKEISVFFLPHIPPGGRRTVQVSFRWPGYVKRLFEGFTVEFAYGYPTGFPTKTTSVELSVEFPRSLGKVDCANKSIGDESASLKIENMGSGNTRWVYSNRRALLAKDDIILCFDRAKKKR